MFSQSVLDQYHAFQAKNFLKSRAQTSDEAIYEAQLVVLAQEEQCAAVDGKIILGVFLFIYLQIDINNETTMADKANDTRGIKPCKNLRLALDNHGFTLDKKEHKLTDIADYFRNSMTVESDLASTALQEAFLFFRSFKIIINNEVQPFFTPAQQLLICQDNFLCAMLHIKSYSRLENITPCMDDYFQIIENAAKNIEKVTESLLRDFEVKGEYAAEKLSCLLTLDSVYFSIKAMNKREFLSTEMFLEKIMGNFFLDGLYIQNKDEEYENIRKIFFFGAMALEGVLFNSVNIDVQQSIFEWAIKPSAQKTNVTSDPITEKILPITSVEEVLLSSFFEKRVSTIFCDVIPLIDWKKFPQDMLDSEESFNVNNDSQLVKLFLDALLVRHPKIKTFLSAELIVNEMKQVRDESLRGTLASSIINHVRKNCDFMQRTRLLDALTDQCAYGRLAYNLSILCDIDLNSILEDRLVTRYSGVYISVIASLESTSQAQKILTLRQQIQLACADRAILYIYQEYLYSHFTQLEKTGLFIPEALLQSDASYEAWSENPLLKDRSARDSKALYDWFKERRPIIEDWYQEYYCDYSKRWNDFFFIEVRNRCLLLAENSSFYQDKRVPLTEIFNNVPQMHFVLTPYKFFKIIDSFQARLTKNVARYGRENLGQKDRALRETIDGINRDMAKVLLDQALPSIIGLRLLKCMQYYAEEHERQYISLLQDLLGENCPRISDADRSKSDNQFQLEKCFLIYSLLSNLLNYIFTYAYVDNASNSAKCAWNGVSGRANGKHWGLVTGEIFNPGNNNSSMKTLEEMLDDPQCYAIAIPDFYEIFQSYNQHAGVIFENQDLIDMFVPLAPPKRFLSGGVFGRGLGGRGKTALENKAVENKA